MAERHASRHGDGKGYGYGSLARILHWTTVLAVMVMIPVGMAMTSEGFEAIGDQLYIVHKNLGVLILLLIAVRLAWRLTHPPTPLPDSVPPLQRRIAGTTHALLYALLLIMPVTGYIRTVGGDFPIELLNALGVPPLVPVMEETAKIVSVIHKFSAYALLALITAHVTAALHHALIDRDGIFSRIWPLTAKETKR